jgi:hypothetical protein
MPPLQPGSDLRAVVREAGIPTIQRYRQAACFRRSLSPTTPTMPGLPAIIATYCCLPIDHVGDRNAIRNRLNPRLPQLFSIFHIEGLDVPVSCRRKQQSTRRGQFAERLPKQTARSSLGSKLAVRNLALIFRLNCLAAQMPGVDFPFDRLGIRYIRKAQIPYRRLS